MRLQARVCARVRNRSSLARDLRERRQTHLRVRLRLHLRAHLQVRVRIRTHMSNQLHECSQLRMRLVPYDFEMRILRP